MKPEEQRIKIAEACGWNPSPLTKGKWCHDINMTMAKNGAYSVWEGVDSLSNYLNDLNAMHVALKSQTQAFRAEFDKLLHAMAKEKHLLVTELEAKDWADCFISCLQSQRESGN